MCLVGCIVAEKILNKDSFRSTMMKVWKLTSTIVFYNVGENLYLLEFMNEQDINRVKVGRPWMFDKNLFVTPKKIIKIFIVLELGE